MDWFKEFYFRLQVWREIIRIDRIIINHHWQYQMLIILLIYQIYRHFMKTKNNIFLMFYYVMKIFDINTYHVFCRLNKYLSSLISFSFVLSVIYEKKLLILNNNLKRQHHHHQYVHDVKHHSVTYLIPVMRVQSVQQKFVNNVDWCIMLMIMVGYANYVANRCK